MKHVHVFSLGGTIAMTKNEENSDTVVPTLSGEDLIKALPELQEKVKLSATSFRNVPSGSLSMDDIIELADRINNLEIEYSGIVVTHGTDTIEETSFALDLLVHRNIPIVVTGAMRNPTVRGADGPANLIGSILLASSDEAYGLGTVVVLNDEIHAARYVRKNHTQSLAAFQSYFGPLGWIAEGKPKVAVRVNQYDKSPFDKIGPDVPVALLTVTLGDDGRLLRNLKELGYGGAIIEALGGGHVPAVMVNELEKLARDMPVVIASRAGNGKILEQTYGYSGSETDLFGRGLISAGWLDGRKCRILLHLLLRTGASYEEIINFFYRFTNGL
jgi:L-asparaginase